MGNFPVLTIIPGVGHEHRQDVVCTSHGVHPLVEFLQNCCSVPRRCEGAVFFGLRALSSHGLCAVDVAKVSARHRCKPGSKPKQTLWRGVGNPPLG